VVEHWTIGDALAFLDPPIPRRTLARLLKQLPPIGLVPSRRGGPLVHTYRPEDVMRVHAHWVRRKVKALS
jgi:hypothetical protein